MQTQVVKLHLPLFCANFSANMAQNIAAGIHNMNANTIVPFLPIRSMTNNGKNVAGTSAQALKTNFVPVIKTSGTKKKKIVFYKRCKL